MPVGYCGIVAFVSVLLACELTLAGAMIRVIDAESGAPLSNVQVRLSTVDEAGIAVWESETDADGLARPAGIRAEVYRLEAEKEGYLDPAGTAPQGRAVRITGEAESRLLVPMV